MAGIPSERFFTVLSSVLNVDREGLHADSSRDSVEQWDSMKHMSLIMALEEEFGIEFSDHEITNLSTASALMQAISAKSGGSRP
jgi:acyl carrier protein